jgi:hypothetical protein
LRFARAINFVFFVLMMIPTCVLLDAIYDKV